MAVLSMKRMNLFALKKDRKLILETLQRLGVVEISEIESSEAFSRIETDSYQLTYNKNSDVAKRALEVLEKNVPEKKGIFSSLYGRKNISQRDYYNFVDSEKEIMRIANELIAFDRSVYEKKAEISKKEMRIESLKPWTMFDLPLRFKGTEFTQAFIGTLPNEVSEEEILSKIFEDSEISESIHVEIIDKSPEQTCIFVLCLKNESALVEDTLRSMGFAYPTLPPKAIPSQKVKILEKEIQDLKIQVSDIQKKIVTYQGFRNALKFIEDYYKMRADKYDAISKLAYTEHIFMLTGYIAEKNTKKLEKILSQKYNVALEFISPDPDEDVPVILKNNKFAKPVEEVLEGYSLPGKGEIDPTNVMAVFYYILFGMMLSDAAYGLIMSIACAFVLIKFKDMEEKMKKTMKMFFFCGLSTVFWGVMFGSYFGDAVDVISTTFFNTHLTIPALWFVPINEPMRLLSFALLVGIIHIFTGLFLGAVQMVKNKRYFDVMVDIIPWYLLVGGAVIYLLSMESMTSMLAIKFTLPGAAGQAAMVCMIVGAVVIVIMSGRSSKNIVKRFLKGLYGLYGATGYLSDILSYSRLLALGLATGVIAQVFNKIGSMFGGGIVGAIIFVLVFLMGHSLNIGINLLGAYVHTNRLQFVEFLGKFYEGGGRKFSPFSENTKYYKITEEINNG